MQQYAAAPGEPPLRPPVPLPPPRLPRRGKHMGCTFQDCPELHDGGLALVQIGDPSRTKQWPCPRHRALGSKLGWEEVGDET